VNFPALPQETYTIRAKLTHNGETDTVTFSGVEVKTVSAGASETDEMSWAQTVLIAFIFLIVLGLFGGLTFFVLRFGADESLNEKTVSA
jgi:heme/copper-type cytochrome/quinol oxidase subunit 2